jgi:cytochrome c
VNLKLLAVFFSVVFIVPSAFANEELMSKKGCVSCHRVDQKLVGPSYKQVAAKYKSDPDAEAYLLEKVREGGEGVWGDMPMPANSPEKVSDADLKILVDWILQL